MKKKILFISGSVGLGHVIRDLAIAKELRKQNPEFELCWIASEPAVSILKNKGEKLLPDAEQWAKETEVMENVNKDPKDKRKVYSVNLAKYLYYSKEVWRNNVRIFKNLMNREQFDLIIGDEAYEIVIALRDSKIRFRPKLIMLYDFIGLDSMTLNPFEKLIVYNVNKGWAKGYKKVTHKLKPRLFIGELEDVPNKRFGFLLPNRRKIVEEHYHTIGYILPFTPENYNDKKKIRKKLGYDKEPLIICSIGGTSIGKPILELCVRSFPLIKKKIPKLRMILVCGPRISAKSINASAGVVVKEYIPNLYEHFAACDLAIVQGGATTTLELTALNRPFIYFPIKGHCEQEIHVAARLARHKAGIKMMYSKTNPQSLAETVISNIGKETNYSSIPTDGAQNAVKIINQFLENI